MFYWSKLLAPFAPRDGRVSQMSYIVGFVAPCLVMVGLSWLLIFGAPDLLGTAGYSIAALGWTFVLATGDAYNVRRWHDLGNSAAIYKLLRPCLFLLPVLALVMQFLVPAHLAAAGDVESLILLVGMEIGGFQIQPAPLALLAITAFGVVANSLYLSLAPGQIGPNAYGPDPRSGGIPLSALAPSAADPQDDPVQRALAAYQRDKAAAAAPAAGKEPAFRPMTGGAFGRKKR